MPLNSYLLVTTAASYRLGPPHADRYVKFSEAMAKLLLAEGLPPNRFPSEMVTLEPSGALTIRAELVDGGGFSFTVPADGWTDAVATEVH